MASIVTKKIKGKDYFYIQAYEKGFDGKSKQKTFYGGSTRQKAEIIPETSRSSSNIEGLCAGA